MLGIGIGTLKSSNKGNMIKERWKIFKYKTTKYKVSNYGRIWSYYHNRLLCGSIKQGKTYLEISIKNKVVKRIPLDKIVCKLFKNKRIKSTEYVKHKNGIMLDDRNKNLKPELRSKLMLDVWQRRRQKFTLIGVYSFNSKVSNKKFRAVICKNKKPITIGYTNTYSEAYNLWKTEYIKNSLHIQ